MKDFGNDRQKAEFMDRLYLEKGSLSLSRTSVQSKHTLPLLAVLLFFIPILIGLQPFFPKPLQTVLIYSRLLICPLLILIYLRSWVNFYLLVLFVLYLIVPLMFNPSLDFRDFALTLLSLFSSIAFFKIGSYLANRDTDNHQFIYLSYGINVFNIITLILYYLLDMGLIDIDSFFMTVQKELIELYRFSILNPIELPFIITSLLYASIVLIKDKKHFLFSVSLNLLVTLLSQSRLLVIMASLLFIHELVKSKWKTKIIYSIIILLMFNLIISLINDTALSLDRISDIASSYLDRFAGKDFGSAAEREQIFKIVFEDLSALVLLFGNGLTASLTLMLQTLGKYRTIESLLFQMIYDTGILGLCLFIAVLFLNKNSVIVPNRFSLILFFAYVQMFIFLPVFTGMQSIFFLFGACSKPISTVWIRMRPGRADKLTLYRRSGHQGSV